MTRLRTALVYSWAPFANLLLYLYTAVLGTIALALAPFDRDRSVQHACARLWCRLIALTAGARVRVYGKENIRADQTYVYMANHTSLIDIPALIGYLPFRFSMIAKKELLRMPFLGWYLRRAGHFPVDRSDARNAARDLRHVIEEVRAGRSLAVFPEGTRSADGRLLEFKPGAFKIAVRAGVHIVPVTIRGAHECLPRGSLAPRPGRVDVIISAPIDTTAYRNRCRASPDSLPELIERTRQAIASNLDSNRREIISPTGSVGSSEQSKKRHA
ncbi:MAG: 1-acyl-sn-glycerol-3-phosphate acyltransferase [Blastocatellia bacterium]|nr:1-acyl-sn-glycerol-3-phosphate acyltransferase [Blastocatellia bacterium]